MHVTTAKTNVSLTNLILAKTISIVITPMKMTAMATGGSPGMGPAASPYNLAF